MILNNEQKMILDKWFDAYTEMYNEGIKYLKTNYTFTKHELRRKRLVTNNEDIPNLYNFYSMRNNLMEQKEIIKNRSQITTITKNTKIHTHNLDYALRQLSSNLKSAISNLRMNNIKHFRIRYWKKDRPSKTIDIEKCCILKNKLCPNILGNIEYIYNSERINLNNITNNVKINYNKILDEYTLLVPIQENNRSIPNKEHNLISLDPGLRTFMTGISEDGFVKIGNNVNSIIEKKIQKLNNIKNNENIKNKIKKKNEFLINKKISNKIDDLHWKTIKYLTHNYRSILLGNMSAKSIVKKNNSVLRKTQKVACLRTKYYVFRQRLEYKCLMFNVNYKLVSEYRTSKTCSNCGNYNEVLGASCVYYCSKCRCMIDRDINGARNIYIRSLC
jgi:transposase